jgi:hypothetical protein
MLSATSRRSLAEEVEATEPERRSLSALKGGKAAPEAPGLPEVGLSIHINNRIRQRFDRLSSKPT